MSAVAHGLESRGVATVVLAGVLPQVEKTRPPRALMTPFQLGRPLGEPGDAGYQLRVLLQALRLLERPDGPVILDHFDEDPPGWFDRPGWRPALAVPAWGALNGAADWAAALQAELGPVMTAWQGFQARNGRSTVGLAGQPPQDWPSFAASFLEGARPAVPLHPSPALALRFLADDLKALYGEAAQADGGRPAARQIDAWFWRGTVAGQLLVALRTQALNSEDKAFKTAGGRFLVPAPWVPQ